MPKTTVYADEIALLHDTGHSHPERPDRMRVILELLGEKPFSDLPRGTITPANEGHLLLAHPLRYIEHVHAMMPEKGRTNLDSETILSPHSWECAMAAAGAAVSAIDDIANKKTTRAFCAMRPPGHHAEQTVSMGFCLFNNIFIAARHAQNCGFKKIAIVDFDVHHGNGTDAMARMHDGSIFFVSTHQYPLWPMTGLEEDNEESVLNFTLAPYTGSKEMRSLYEAKVFPAVETFKPDLILSSAGFDAHRDDPIAQLNWDEDDFQWVTEKLCALADKHCGGKIMTVLEGGYNLDALKASVAVHLATLAGVKI